MSLPNPSYESTAVVTGASSGIGEEIARELAGRGHGVTLVARRADRLEHLAKELTNKGVRVEVLPADLSERAARTELPGRIEALGLTPDILVNNAGLSTLGPVHRADPGAEINLVEVDVAAVVDLCTRLLPGMVERGRGAIINVASTAAFQPMPGQAAYAAAKAFVLSYSRALTGELRGTGVTVTAHCPGPVHTEFEDVAGFENAENSLPSFMWVTAAEVARAAVSGADKGSAVVIPGQANRLGAAMAHLAPKRLLVPIVAKSHPGLKN